MMLVEGFLGVWPIHIYFLLDAYGNFSPLLLGSLPKGKAPH